MDVEAVRSVVWRMREKAFQDVKILRNALF